MTLPCCSRDPRGAILETSKGREEGREAHHLPPTPTERTKIMKATASSILRKITGRKTALVQPQPVTVGDAVVAHGIALPVESDVVAELRSMIDKGRGGARGLSAATRLQAMRGLDQLVRLDAEYAAQLARVVRLGERSQGRVITDLIERGQGVSA